MGHCHTTKTQLKLSNLLQSEGEQPSCRLCSSSSFTIISLFFISFLLSGVISMCVISVSRTLPAGRSPHNTGNHQQQKKKKKKTLSHWAIISPLTTHQPSLGFQAMPRSFRPYNYPFQSDNGEGKEEKKCMFVTFYPPTPSQKMYKAFQTFVKQQSC